MMALCPLERETIPEAFSKYMTYSTANIVLENQTLRWCTLKTRATSSRATLGKGGQGKSFGQKGD
jgi:hypothetical protein